MAPKKGGGPDGLLGAIQTVLWLPFSLTSCIFFYPMHWFMYIVLDCLGDRKWKEDWAWKNQLVSKWKDKITYLKEFRLCLYEFGWRRSPSPPWRCKFCGNEGSIWCVDCSKKFCAQCAYNHHAPGMSANMHSLEEFFKKEEREKGVALFTPIFAETIFIVLLIYVVFGSYSNFIEKDYLTTQVACPIVSRTRSVVASIDASLFHHFKQNFFQWCEMEDSFQRFTLDAWVRTMVTGTDNTLLVFQTLPQAMLFDVVLLYTVVPIFAICYAFVFNLFLQLEDMLPRTGEVGVILVRVESIVEHFNFLENFGSGNYSSLPPETKERRREAMDPIDYFRYWKNKKIRYFKYYYNDTSDTLKGLVWSSLLGIIGFRLGCLWLGLNRPFRWLAAVILPSTFKLHQEWFASASNIVVTEERLGHFSKTALSMVSQYLAATPRSLTTMCILWFILAICCVGVLGLVCDYLIKKRREFVRAWNSPGAEQGTGRYALNLGLRKYELNCTQCQSAVWQKCKCTVEPEKKTYQPGFAASSCGVVAARPK